MEFIQHTIEWCRGEIFEGKLSILFGIVILLASLGYWKFGSTDAAKAMFVPLLMVALLSIAIGAYLIQANSKRITHYTEQFEQTPAEFILSEQERTAAFIKWYPYTQYILFGLGILAMLCLILSNKPLLRAIGIALLLLVLYMFTLDHFSEERAYKYRREITKQLES
ncbi:MAG: hypothetical protein KJO23_07010 [Bacteroidia bacterium]|nr:hypothetical protein [Bacteroidia bacterium]NNM23442.1 hypothetical protein [Flavobacteriaceae bacterium]